jgi:hypothetical protein
MTMTVDWLLAARDGSILALGFGWMIGTLAVSTAMAEARGTTDFGSLAVHCFLVAMAFNLADWLLLDELWIGVLKPRWAIPAGIDPASVPFERARHFQGFVRGSIMFAVLGMLIALVVRLV